MTAVMPDRDTYSDQTLQHSRRLPSPPLVAAVKAAGGYAACAGIGQNHTTLARMWERAKAQGTVTWVAADVLSVRLLGLHPLLVWGDDWLELLWELDEHPPRWRRPPAA